MKSTREQVLLQNAIIMLLEELHGNDEVDKQYLIENLGITEEELNELDLFDNIDEKFEKHLITEVDINGISDASFVADYCNFIPKDGKEYCVNNEVSIYDIDEYVEVFNKFTKITFMNAVSLCKMCHKSYDFSGHELNDVNDLVQMLRDNDDFSG